MAKGTVNKVLLIGRLGQDPDIRYSKNGNAVAKFSLATNERVPSGDGEYKDETEWHRVVAFGKTAEFIGNYMTKGKVAWVEGRLRTSSWEDQDGNKRFATEILANEVQLVGGNGANGESSGNSNSNSNKSQSQNKRKPSESSTKKRSDDNDFGGFSDDIPF